jgi:signal peptidase I
LAFAANWDCGVNPFMLGSYEQYRTTKDTFTAKNIFKLIIKILIFGCLVFIFISSFIINSYRVHSAAMNPTLADGEMVLSCPLAYGTYSYLLGFRFPGFLLPKRGDIVIVKPPYFPKQSFFNELLTPFIKFFSLQQARLVRDPTGKPINEYIIKRVVGIPGDTIKVERFIVYIKPQGEDRFKSERELTGDGYKIYDEFSSSIFPKEWTPGLPFSGNVQEFMLGKDEYFLLSDNRLLFSDSRFFGPVKYDLIVSKVIFRYWPFEKFGGL